MKVWLIAPWPAAQEMVELAIHEGAGRRVSRRGFPALVLTNDFLFNKDMEN